MEKYTTLTPWQRFINLMKLERKDIYRIVSYAVFSGLVGLTLPLGVQTIINLIQGGQVNASWIVLVFFVIVGVGFGGYLQFLQLRIAEDVQQRIFTRSSLEFIYRFPKIKMEAFYGSYPPEIANRFFDTISIQKGLAKFIIDFSGSLLQIIFGLILLSFYHPFFIVFGLLLVVLIYAVFKFTAPEGLRTSLLESKYKYKVAHWIEEVARSLQSFKMSGKTSLAMEKNDKLVVSYLDAREGHFNILRVQFFKMIGFKVIVTAGLLLIGGLLVLNQQMNIGQFVAAEIIILLIISSVEKLMLGLENVYDILTSIEKIGQVVDLPLENIGGQKPLQKSKPLKIQLENIHLHHPGRPYPTLKNINLEIHPGEKICITGHNGSGKTSLLYIISGLTEPNSGQIFINDVSLNQINLNHYRSHLGFSITGSNPFEGTIRENITFNNPEISEEDLQWAIEKTRLSEFIRSLPQGLETFINPEGRQLSYTISKKIILARAVVHKPSLLILKDPLDQMDEVETKHLQNFLFHKENSWSLLIVSKNERWKKLSDRVVELEQGSIKN